MRYQKGEIVAGTVTGILDYGLFVQLDESSSGLVHISEMSTHYVKNVEDFAHLGEVIRVKIIDILENNKYCLSIKNIDYRILTKRRSKIEETKLGFSSLALSLQHWIEDSSTRKEQDRVSHFKKKDSPKEERTPKNEKKI